MIVAYRLASLNGRGCREARRVALVIRMGQLGDVELMRYAVALLANRETLTYGLACAEIVRRDTL